ncbi:MAG: PSD1 domain-containing protein, partial [Planctomycetaceae bacterium]|nr:PSD1 domain-containing protein [Planctomycetaceae bacterium]
MMVRSTSWRMPFPVPRPAMNLVYGFVVLLLSTSAIAAESLDFERDIAPLFVRHCLECHNDTAETGGLSLTSHGRLMQGGESGPALNKEPLGDSPLLQRVLDGEMPPPKENKPQIITSEEIDLLKRWVAAGAHWPEGRVLDPYERTTDARAGRDWWSLQPIERPEMPSFGEADSSTNPIDAFIRRPLSERGWQPAPPADRRTLLRRLTYDFIGLPPTPEEYAAFERDESPDAYQQVVDRLLASPQFGERWGRYWLDLVRYADTCGYERDQEKIGVWKYRDWVIAAINDDMPYDQFVLAQLAGDELPNRDESTVIATGFLRLGTWNDEPNDPQEYKYERLEDMVHATSTAFLGLTVKCARCHDHKFDPIPQTDYYRMASAFWAGPIEPGDRNFLGGPSADELGYDVFGWTDRGREVPPLHLLKNGDPKHPLGVVEPGQLTAVTFLDNSISPPPADASTTRRRLQIADWIVDEHNPLTARVLVNRLWQHHFGEGLVRTPNNFGFNGNKPAHPELLDWLADELMHPISQERSPISQSPWTLKRMHKLIVMSETYRQSADHPLYHEYSASDPGNQLWWRSERRRLDADALRDSLLVAGGQLDLTPGGPGFKPTIDPEALEGLSKKSGAWQASPPEQQLRRSIYTYLQRSLLPPTLAVFDQPDTTLPCGQRDVTTVAPQALALMNNPFVHERSETLAARLMEESDSVDTQIEAAWQAILSRPPTADELRAAVAHLESQQQRFEEQLETPKQPRDPDLAPQLLTDGLTLHLSARDGVTTDDQGRVESWSDLSPAGHHASQPNAESRPLFVDDRLRFEGRNWLALDGQLLTSQQYTLLAVVT